MRFPSSRWLSLILVVVAVGILCLRLLGPHYTKPNAGAAIHDMSITSPLNQPGGGEVSADAYEVYSALYRATTAGAAGLCRRIQNRHSPGEWKLPETQDSPGTRDDRCFCGCEPAKPSLGEKVHDYRPGICCCQDLKPQRSRTALRAAERVTLSAKPIDRSGICGISEFLASITPILGRWYRSSRYAEINAEAAGFLK